MATPQYTDRYQLFRQDGKINLVPFIPILKQTTDKFITYNLGISKVSLISNDFYGSPFYDWLILSANPENGSLEAEIPDGTTLRIPFPLKNALDKYYEDVNTYNKI